MSHRTSLSNPLALRVRRGAASRGVTLVEVGAVVAIIGVMAALAVVGYGRYVKSAKMAEGTNMVAAIKNGQENYFSQTGRYLDVSKGVKPPNMYPAQTPGPKKVQWGAPCEWCNADWQRLGVVATGPVFFGFATVAGVDTCDPDCRGIAFDLKTGNVNWTAEAGGAIQKPWYIVTGVADPNGNGVFAKVVGFSFGTRIITDNEEE